MSPGCYMGTRVLKSVNTIHFTTQYWPMLLKFHYVSSFCPCYNGVNWNPEYNGRRFEPIWLLKFPFSVKIFRLFHSILKPLKSSIIHFYRNATLLGRDCHLFRTKYLYIHLIYVDKFKFSAQYHFSDWIFSKCQIKIQNELIDKLMTQSYSKAICNQIHVLILFPIVTWTEINFSSFQKIFET